MGVVTSRVAQRVVQRLVEQLSGAFDQTQLASLLVDEVEQLASRSALERFFAPGTMERLQEVGDLEELLAPRPQEVTLLSLDIRHFSEVCQDSIPDQLSYCLGEYFQIVCEVIFSRGGTIETIVGDRLAALFNAPVKQEGHERLAVETAVAIQQAVHNAPNSWIRAYCRTGIGLTWGRPLVGMVGPGRRADYLAIGKEVCAVRELERLAHSGQILVTQALFERLEGAFESRPVEGLKVDDAPVYELLY